MARNVEDLALMLDAMSGEHPGDPLSLPLLPSSFLSAVRLRQQAEADRLFRPTSVSRRSIRRSAAITPQGPRSVLPRPASSSRKPILTCARPMNASIVLRAF